MICTDGIMTGRSALVRTVPASVALLTTSCRPFHWTEDAGAG
jgi:hypothetical protein